MAADAAAGRLTTATSVAAVSAPEPPRKESRARYSLVPESKSKVRPLDPLHQPACHCSIVRESIGAPSAANA